MKLRNHSILITALCFFLFSVTVAAQDTDKPGTLDTTYLEYFTGIGCPNCARIDALIDSIDVKYSGVVIRKYEVFNHTKNHQLMKKRYEQLGIGWSKHWVPVVFLPTKVLSGYTEIEVNLESELLKLNHE